jgi:hypothetical protein
MALLEKRDLLEALDTLDLQVFLELLEQQDPLVQLELP